MISLYGSKISQLLSDLRAIKKLVARETFHYAEDKKRKLEGLRLQRICSLWIRRLELLQKWSHEEKTPKYPDSPLVKGV